MKKFLIPFFCTIFINLAAQEKCVRGANSYGFFADFLWALNHIEYCIAENKTPVIYWGENFAYYSPQGYNGSYNGWEYYFEPVSNLQYNKGDHLHTQSYYKRGNGFSTLWWYYQYIDKKSLLPQSEQASFKALRGHERKYITGFHDQKRHAYPVGKYHLYDKQFRKSVHDATLTPFVKIKFSIQNKIEDFYKANLKGKKTIGLHLRGNHLAKEVLVVPLDILFSEANKYAQEGAQFFIATDQEPLLQEAQKKLKGRVIYYPCQRFGSTTSPYPGKKLDPKLGEDLLIETIILSCCDHFIHTLSNVSTAALYFNPELEHTLIY